MRCQATRSRRSCARALRSTPACSGAAFWVLIFSRGLLDGSYIACCHKVHATPSTAHSSSLPLSVSQQAETTACFSSLEGRHATIPVLDRAKRKGSVRLLLSVQCAGTSTWRLSYRHSAYQLHTRFEN